MFVLDLQVEYLLLYSSLNHELKMLMALVKVYCRVLLYASENDASLQQYKLNRP